jgi:hypothetical protein
MKTVWLVLVRVVANPGESQTFTDGSEALAQCLFPTDSLPAALDLLPSFLAESGFELKEHLLAEKYKLEDPTQEYPTERLRDWIRKTAETGRPGFGMFFYCNQEASLAAQSG